MKIFGTGLSKTGSVSLFYAMKHLGFSCKHYIYVDDCEERPTVNHIKPIVDKYKFINGAPINYMYRELAELYPNSKYIWMTRNFEQWIESCKAHFEQFVTKSWHRTLLWGTLGFDFEKFRVRYYDHMCDMIDFSLSHDVLELPLEMDDHWKWVRLCEFLNMEIANQFSNFPHANKDEDRVWVDLST